MDDGRWGWGALLWLCATLAAGCAAPPPAPPPIPAPQIVRIQYAPGTAPLLPALSACFGELPALAPRMEERPPTRLEPSEADLTLWWGKAPPESGFAYLLGYDSLRVVVSAQREGGEPTPFEVAAIYRGYAPPENESAPAAALTAWTYPEGHPFRQSFEASLLEGASTSSAARLAPHSQAMLEGVAGDPQAVGYLPSFWLSAAVHPLEIALPPQPVLALSPREPQGAARNLLACWQAKLEGTLAPRP